MINLNKNKYRIDEAAEYYQVSKRTVYNWIRLGNLKVIGKSTGCRITKESVIKLQEESKFINLKPKEKLLKENLNNRIASGMYRSIRGKKSTFNWEQVLGFTVDDLKKHLENKFVGKMSWERFLNGEIHIDHIVPLSVFNFISPDYIDFKKCWSLKNLQPMWAKENIRKGAKLKGHFQPSLLLSVK